MIHRRHPAVAGQILQELSQPHVVAAAAAAREELVCIGFVAPSWAWLAGPGHGWQQAATDPVACLVSLSLVFLPARWHASTLHCSRSCSSVVSGFLSLLLRAAAGVAVSWTSLATTVQLVRRLECWVVGVMRWSQPLPEFAGRQEPGWALISCS